MNISMPKKNKRGGKNSIVFLQQNFQASSKLNDEKAIQMATKILRGHQTRYILC